MPTKKNQAADINDKKDRRNRSKLSDEVKPISHTPKPGTLTKKENPKDGNIGKNNAGGRE